ncbi:uncharacterized protein LOC143214198 [Lasioglossum baleicum]|uniref:uncharacterized protein LOC143214198 n=1 Tax=Lasioglossum baleicum TaxID=434251 RepID=UPI003FCCFAD2
MQNSLRISLWNCRSLLNKKAEITGIAARSDIMVCTETWFSPQQKFSISGFNSVRKDRTCGRGGGIAIFIAKDLKYNILNSIAHNDLQTETCCIQITNTQEKVIIAAIYRPPSTNFSTTRWNTFIQDVKDIGPYLIMGDFNSHHTDWNCSKIDDFLHIAQDDDPHGSDHFPLYITFKTTKHLYRKVNNKLSSIRTDWEKYSNLMDSYIASTLHQGYTSALDKYSQFTEWMRPYPGPRRDPEFHSQHKMQRAIENQHLEAGRRHNSSRTLPEAERRRDGFAEAKSRVSDRPKCCVRKAEYGSGGHSASAYPGHRVKIHCVYFASADRRTNKSLPNIRCREKKVNPNIALLVSPNEYGYSDGIDYKMIKCLSTKCRLNLLDIYIEIFRTSCLPEEWNKCQILFIKKADNNGFRPISLTSCMCKIMERMINNRLLWWCETTNQLPPSQMGFRKGRSSIDNIFNITAYIRTGFVLNQVTAAAFLDVSAAYDNVQWNILLKKLSEIGIPFNTLSFIANWSYCRFASSPSFQGVRTIFKGLPQGGVLSPLLYNLYVADIFKGIPKEVHISQYADDIALYSRSSALRDVKISIERALNKCRDRDENACVKLNECCKKDDRPRLRGQRRTESLHYEALQLLIIEFMDFIRNYYNNHLCILTDGSKVKGAPSTGLAVVCPEENIYLPITGIAPDITFAGCRASQLCV